MPTSSSARLPLAITFAVQAASVVAITAIVVSQLSASNDLVQQQMARVHTRLVQASQANGVAAVPAPARPAEAPQVVALAASR